MGNFSFGEKPYKDVENHKVRDEKCLLLLSLPDLVSKFMLLAVCHTIVMMLRLRAFPFFSQKLTHCKLKRINKKIDICVTPETLGVKATQKVEMTVVAPY